MWQNWDPAQPKKKKQNRQQQKILSLSTERECIIGTAPRLRFPRWWWQCLVTMACLTLCDPVDYSPPGSSVQARILDCPLLLHGIFPTHGSNLHLPHWQVNILLLSYWGSHHIWYYQQYDCVYTQLFICFFVFFLSFYFIYNHFLKIYLICNVVLISGKILYMYRPEYWKVSSQPSDWTQVSCIAGRFFTSWPSREAHEYWSG